ncbi:MAG: M48 family metallopeptidase [Bacteroidales bacterium]|nr:M48 family metallopeptidase [Bacteroidales bacterium]
MSEKIFYLEDIGNVKIRKSKRSKNVSIAIKPDQGVIVTLPYFISYKHGLRVLDQRKDWIKKHLPKIKAIEEKTTVFSEDSDFKTRNRTLIIKKHNSEKVKSIIKSDSVQIFYPENVAVNNSEIQNIIKTSIIKALRIEAKEYLPERTSEIAQKLNLSYNKLFVKNNKTLWGSCSGKNNINLNLHLMRLPNHLIDYVIIHELCHTLEKNHGAGFWGLMDSILGDSKKISKELKQFSIRFY